MRLRATSAWISREIVKSKHLLTMRQTANVRNRVVSGQAVPTEKRRIAAAPATPEFARAA